MSNLVQINYTGFERVIRKLAHIHRTVNNPDTDEMVKGAASIWDANFRGEGSAVGGWIALSPMTRRVRAERGYDPEHPILVQTGTLQRVAISSLLAGSPGNSFGKGVSRSYIRRQMGAELRVSGAKVDNQFRIRQKGVMNQPPRPFWFVNAQVEAAVRDGLWRWLAKELGKA